MWHTQATGSIPVRGIDWICYEQAATTKDTIAINGRQLTPPGMRSRCEGLRQPRHPSKQGSTLAPGGLSAIQFPFKLESVAQGWFDHSSGRQTATRTPPLDVIGSPNLGRRRRGVHAGYASYGSSLHSGGPGKRVRPWPPLRLRRRFHAHRCGSSLDFSRAAWTVPACAGALSAQLVGEMRLNLARLGSSCSCDQRVASEPPEAGRANLHDNLCQRRGRKSRPCHFSVTAIGSNCFRLH